ncbi:MAG TPA: T9SS type A sorting domain-containing protein, partial [Saprospiraceae bacterium]|nr:T9SS type A sorting domain-containing protein [Saprospiraceae bacterium]
VEFITRFEDFADPNVPYMYHCHLHPHEDDGMMGSFRVIDPTTAIQEANGINGIFSISPNPANDLLLIHFENPIPDNVKISVTDIAGKPVQVWTTSSTSNLLQLNTTGWSSGLYIITLESGSVIETQKLLVQHQ